MGTINNLLELWEKEHAHDMASDDARERRKFARLVYPSAKRPRLIVGKFKTEVINISEKGLKFLKKNDHTEIGKQVIGTVVFLNGKSLNVTGKIIWHSASDVGLLMDRIPRPLIIEEIQSLLQEKGLNESDWEKYTEIMTVTSLLANDMIKIIDGYRDMYPGTTWKQVKEALSIVYRIFEDKETTPKKPVIK